MHRFATYGVSSVAETDAAQLAGEALTFNEWLENKVRQGFEPDTEAPLGSSDNPSSKILTVANVITVCRMLLTVVFLVLFVEGVNRPLALVIYTLAACTDWLDGQVARRTQSVSWFGKILDPICDRFLLFTGVLGLVLTEELPAWVACFVIGRDVYLAIGGLIVRQFRERPVDVTYVGKTATALLMTGFCLLLLGVPVLNGFGITKASWLPLLNSTKGPLGLLFVYVGCVFSFLAAVLYTVEGAAIVKEALKRNKKAA